MKAILLQLHRWLGVLLFPLFAMIVLSGALLALKPMVESARTPDQLQPVAVEQLVALVDEVAGSSRFGECSGWMKGPIGALMGWGITAWRMGRLRGMAVIPWGASLGASSPSTRGCCWGWGGWWSMPVGRWRPSLWPLSSSVGPVFATASWGGIMRWGSGSSRWRPCCRSRR